MSFDFPKSSSYSFKKTSGASSFIPCIIMLEKEWDPIIIFANFKRSYDYLGVASTGGLTSITKSQLSQRGSREINRFFDKSKSLDTPDILKLPNDTKKNLKDLDSSKDAYLSPLAFNYGKEVSNLENLQSINDTKLTDDFLKSKKESSKISERFKSFRKTQAQKKQKNYKK